MSDDNSMDVDDPPKTLLPSPIISSSFPLQAEVDKFTERMIWASKLGRWSSNLTKAGSDKEEQRGVIFSVLLSIESAVSSQTVLKKNFIDFSIENIGAIVKSLNDAEVEEWKNIVQKGDWVGLIKHRMCLVCFRRRYIVMRYWHRETSEIS